MAISGIIMIKRILSLIGTLSVACFFCSIANAADTITVNIEGNVATSCGIIIASPNVTNLDFTQSGGHTIPFTVDCNAPFAYSLVSSNGGFKNAIGAANVVSTSATFTSLIPYTVNTNFSVDTGGTFGNTGLISTNLTAANAAPCDATAYNEALCPYANSGAAAAAGLPASLSVFWNQTTSAPLVGGTFSDTITLTVRIKS